MLNSIHTAKLCKSNLEGFDLVVLGEMNKTNANYLRNMPMDCNTLSRCC